MDSSDGYQKLLNDLELQETNMWKSDESKLKYLYPTLNDPLFNKKIAEKREFNDTKYNGEILDISTQAKKLCDSEFELSPHQQFVKNFLSLYTPYNSLLLYHGLGSGKTCSAIGVAEDMRDYIRQMGINQRIIIVASPNVQNNFKLQLFDETKLELVDGLWNIKSCTGNKLLKEINPLNMRGLTRERVITLIKNLINTSYLFLGYTEFANYIQKKSIVASDLISDKEKIVKQKLKQIFDNRLIIIDEVHNIRFTDDNKSKRIASELLKLVTNVDNLRLLFLSATPLYNTYKEIIWLINIMNLNDRRSTINMKDIFDENGNFIVNSDGKEVGKELLERKATGYISFVRGDNPYTFPFKVWPDQFEPTKTLKNIIYPRVQINGKDVSGSIEFLSLYMVSAGGYQTSGYNYIVNELSKSEQFNIENMEQLGYIQLTKPLEALNIVYPNLALFEEDMDAEIDIKNLVGKGGLNNIMTYKETISPPSKNNFKYKPDILENYGRIFSPENIETYSAKIKAICDNILNSEGVVIIYSQYLDGGVVPIALALEEMGITRYGDTSSLFEKRPIENLDLKTYKNSNSKDTIPAKYIMITGDPKLSPNTLAEVKAATQKSNINGYNVKVILISQAGSEGLDFKFIRQVHILEPWYNLSRIEQIIGRAVRNCSHKDLPLEERNVQIYLYGTQLIEDTDEAADLYVYRLAEQKAIKIGSVTRVLKEIAVDCLLNSAQQNFSAENMKLIIKQKLSNGNVIDYAVGDKPFTAQCDFSDTCMYKCKPENTIGDINELTYSQNFIEMNIEKIINRIRQLMKEEYFYKKSDLISQINIIRTYPLVQIYSALSHLINDKNELITDKYNRYGRLVNIGDYYFFQPIELTDENISIYERSVPIPYKRDKIQVNINEIASVPESQTLKIAPKLKEVAEDIVEGDDSEVDTKELKTTIKDAAKIDKPTKVPLENTPDTSSGKKLLEKMEKDYNISTTPQVIVRGEKDIWYKHSSIILQELESMGTPIEILHELLINHLIEVNLFDDLLNILNYIYFSEKLTDFESKIKNYFDNYLLQDRGVTGILLPGWDSKTKKSIQKLVVIYTPAAAAKPIWKLAEPEDYKDLLPKIKQSIIPKSDVNNIFGFMSNFKNNLMVFKVKDNKPGNTGARCDQGSKLTADKLNSIIGTNTYTETFVKKMSAAYLCVLQEYLLRLNNYNNKNGKKWFLTPVNAILYST
tara:strand:+ start:42 stop:3680 length:3639 start_codon:yes stop_codon:yes gene_type:complete